jgi:hypothetical protein
MSLFESGESSGEISLGDLFEEKTEMFEKSMGKLKVELYVRKKDLAKDTMRKGGYYSERHKGSYTRSGAA